ncbi:MAG: AAA family ATPase [Thermodesulfobacteriota bacterium]
MNDIIPAIEEEAGATWHRLDLHLHSPTVPGFVCPKATAVDDRKGLTDAYVEQLVQQEISVAALTDYNGINAEWFEVTAAKATNRGITLLPGTELTFREGRYGLHVLAIFAGDTDLRVLNQFLRFLDKDPGTPFFDDQGSYRDIRLKTRLAEALKSFRNQFNCLLIFPHPDRTNGLCKSLTTELAAQLLAETGPDAIESMSEKDKKKLQSVGILPQEFWDRTAFVDFSNPKRIEEIGTQYRSNGALRATYLKLSSNRLDALRFAFHDPESRLSVGGIPATIHPSIRSMTVSGSGFLGNLSISWNRDLNVIIGRKGAGKSALLECLRYAFGIMPYSGQSSREELVSQALGPGGKIEVILEKTTPEGEIDQYRIARTWGEEPQTFQIDPEKSLPVRPSELLYPGGGPSILGQREIYAISQSEAHQLELLDELIGEEAHRCAQSLAQAMEGLTVNTDAILELSGKLSKREDYRQRLKKMEQEIEKDKKGNPEKPKEPEPPGGTGYLQDATRRVKTALDDCDNRRLNLFASLDTAHQNLFGAKKQASILQEGAIALAILKEELTVVLNKERSLLVQAFQNLKRLDGRGQENQPPPKREENRNEPAPPAESARQDSTLKLEKERASLISLIAEFNGFEDRLKALRKERQKLFRQARESRAAQYRLRTEKIEAISKGLNGRLRAQVEYNGQKESFKEQLVSLLKGSNISQEVIDQIILSEAADGMTFAEAVRAGSKEVEGRFKLKPEIAGLLIQWLTSEEARLLKLETFMGQDALRLRLGIGGKEKPPDRIPPGQSAAAVMIFLLGLGGRILVIDQPDDYLEDPSVQAEIAQILREQKSSRNPEAHHQVILAARDAILPVMADAELVLPLEVRDDHPTIVGKASVDDRSICQAIKKMMQGGEEAFRQHSEKYGGSSVVQTFSNLG